MITVLQVNLYSTFLKQGYFINKVYQQRCRIRPILPCLVGGNLSWFFVLFKEIYFLLFNYLCLRVYVSVYHLYVNSLGDQKKKVRAISPAPGVR